MSNKSAKDKLNQDGDYTKLQLMKTVFKDV